MNAAAIPLSLYVHIPWCVRKCPYCDFNSHPVEGGMDEAAYVDALLADLAFEANLSAGRQLQSLFFGGGTPSLFSPEAIGRLITAADAHIGLRPDCEITLEANPGTAEAQRFAGYRAAGVNRLSIGVQSFNHQALQRLGRIHDADEARHATILAQDAGFERLNLDLMFALPDQDLEGARSDLEQAIALNPGHISYYQLTLEPGTHFHRHPPALPTHELAWDMQTQGEALLSAAGYNQYEVSAYAQAGMSCRHNLNYWRYGDYLGIGAGAHGKLSASDAIERRARCRMPRHFMQRAGTDAVLAEQSRVATEDRLFEFLLNALRLKQGIELSVFEQHTGLPRQQLLSALKAPQFRDLVAVGPQHIQTTALGWRHLDSLLGALLPAAA